MSKKLIITIARQYGSGGREIGEILSRLLNIPLYDKEIIKVAADTGELDHGVAAKADETATNSLLYTLAMGSNIAGATLPFGYRMPLNDKLFILQSDAIKAYAEEGSCIIIGRCADYVLRDYANVLSLFIYGDLDHRKERVEQRHPEVKPSQIIDLINKTDKRRASYYNFYTGNKWGKYDNYDIAINSSTFGIQGTAQVLATLAKQLMEE